MRLGRVANWRLTAWTVRGGDDNGCIGMKILFVRMRASIAVAGVLVGGPCATDVDQEWQVGARAGGIRISLGNAMGEGREELTYHHALFFA